MNERTETFHPDDTVWRGLTMTTAAADYIRHWVARQPGVQGVRLKIKKSGCAGFGYTLETVSEPDSADLLFESEGVKLWVPRQAMPFIDGTEVDYVHEGINQVFRFYNPSAQHECGCGESFGV